MNKFGWSAVTVLLAGSLLAATVVAQEGYDHEAMAKEWEKYSAPAEQHAYLRYFVGEWNVETTMYLGPEPTVTKGTAHMDLAMGGRYLHQKHRSTFQGVPFEGLGITGFDRAAGEYFTIWLDNMGTGFMEAHGGALKKGKGHEVSGVWNDPSMGEMSFRMVTKIVDDDSFTFDMYMTPAGQDGVGESKSMAIKYTRVST